MLSKQDNIVPLVDIARLEDIISVQRVSLLRLYLSNKYLILSFFFLVRFASSAKVHPHQDGTLQSKINHPTRFLHKLPDTVSYEQASLVEPLSVALHASRRANISPGQSILVLGAGAVGILACSVASAYGATHIVISDM